MQCLQGGVVDGVLLQSWFTHTWNASSLLVMGPAAVISGGVGGDAACAIAIISSYRELLDTVASLANAKPDTNIFIAANVTVPPNNDGSVTLNSRMRVAALPGWPGPSYLSTGFFNEV